LPDPRHRHRNAPTIPTTDLPATTGAGEAPQYPEWMSLGDAGEAWWRWAWRTPQAHAWGHHMGMEPVIARRATLEDELAVMELADGLSRSRVMREMRELDDRLGLTPKGLASLRWRIVTTDADEVSDADEVARRREERRERLSG